MPYFPLRRLFKIALPLVLGSALSLWLFHYFNCIELDRRQQLAERAAQQTESRLQTELQKVYWSLSSLDLLLEQADTVTRSTFESFTFPFLTALTGIRAIEWAPYVRQEERAQHEAQLRAEGFADYQIRVPNVAARRLVEAPIRPFYYPVQYIVPSPLNRLVLGYDLSFEPIRLSTIEQSRQSRRMSISPPMRLVQNPVGTRSFLAVQAVHRDSALYGAVMSVYSVPELIDSVLGSHRQLLDLYLYDLTAGGAPLYNSMATGVLPPFDSVVRASWAAPDTLRLGDRQWLLYCRTKAEVLAYPHQLEAYGFFGVAFLLTLMLAGLLLFQDNHKTHLERKVAKRTEQLNRANREQAVLLKEIHHRVKNNLQVITGLLSLQASSLNDDRVKALFGVSQYRINAMAMLHEQLYQSENLSSINYSAYLRQLVDQLLLSVHGSQHQLEVDWSIPDDLQLNLDTAIPLGLLVNELVTNSLKYAFPEGGRGRLYIHIIPQDYPNFLLLMGDDGVGYSSEITFRSSPSLGLKLIRQLARQLSGQIERSTQERGTHYRLRFQEVQ